MATQNIHLTYTRDQKNTARAITNKGKRNRS